MARKMGDTLSISAVEPPQNTTNFPCSAPVAPPDTGASTHDVPQRACSRCANVIVGPGPIVEKSMSIEGELTLLDTPCSEKSTASRASASDKQTNTASVPHAASAGLVASSAPAAKSGPSLATVRFHTRTPNPAESSRFVIGAPIRPAPMNAMLFILLPVIYQVPP